MRYYLSFYLLFKLAALNGRARYTKLTIALELK